MTVVLRFPAVFGSLTQDLVLRLRDEDSYSHFLDRNTWLLDRAEGVSSLEGLTLWVFPEGRETEGVLQRLRRDGVEVGDMEVSCGTGRKRFVVA